MDKLNHKIAPIYFNGNKIIRISDLPSAQSHLFSSWIKTEALVRLENSRDWDCAKYEDYEFWFLNYFVGEKDLNYLI